MTYKIIGKKKMKERAPFIEDLIAKEFLVPEWYEFSDAFEHVHGILHEIIRRGQPSHPAGENIFRALNECKPENLKVVILGMDPYIDGSAVGLSFDNAITQTKISPSLKAILKEMDDDLGTKIGLQKTELNIKDPISHLCHLPQQGVLLLNTALTVEHKKSGSHLQLWKPFTEQLIKDINKLDNIAWILWGNDAKSYKKLIENKTHYIIEGGHPSPLNRTVPFAGGKYFSECNSFLRTINKTPIQW